VASPSFLLKRLGFKAKEQALEAYEALGVSPYHYAILAVLDEGSRETQGAIADTLGYDRGQLVGLLDELEEQGSIERRRDPEDRRRHIVRMTPAGRKLLGKLRALTARLDDDFFAALDERDREQLQSLLLTLAEAHLPLCPPKP
jgi:MarR family transcriptional regulator, lower aerobic nicotinate degradation pathway regulator